MPVVAEPEVLDPRVFSGEMAAGKFDGAVAEIDGAPTKKLFGM